MSVIFNFIKKPQMTNIESIIEKEIKDFKGSEKYSWFMIGDKYYKGEHDILNRKITINTENGAVEETWKANNKLVHNSIKNLIDEKKSYLLSKPYTLVSDNDNYIEKVKSTLGNHFQYLLNQTCLEASNKGLAWLMAYIDSTGKFKLRLIPTEECIPIWNDSTKTELVEMIRVYNQHYYEGTEKKTEVKVERYTKTEIWNYVYHEGSLVADIAINNGDPKSYWLNNNKAKGWGKVPFIAFRNNHLEYPDIQFIKSLVDGYNLSRSEVSNLIEDVRNLIFVLKNYDGADLAEFLREMNYYRGIKVGDDGGVDTLNPVIDIQAAKEHYEQLKRDINEYGQGVNKDLDKFGSSPSGIALEFMYSGLDLKSLALEVEFKQAFEYMLYFVDMYIYETGQGNFKNVDLQIQFSKDIKINESETIANCQGSVGIISNKTIISKHPWVDDIKAELTQLKKEEKDAGNVYDDGNVEDNSNE